MSIHLARSRRTMRARRRVVLAGLAVMGAAMVVSAHAANVSVHDSNVDIVNDLPGPPPPLPRSRRHSVTRAGTGRRPPIPPPTAR